jgi:hypothetical protein
VSNATVNANGPATATVASAPPDAVEVLDAFGAASTTTALPVEAPHPPTPSAAPHTELPGNKAATVVFTANANATAGETAPTLAIEFAAALAAVTYVGVRGVSNTNPAGATAPDTPAGAAAANTSTFPDVCTAPPTVATVTFVAIVTVTAAPTPITAPFTADTDGCATCAAVASVNACAVVEPSA